MKRHFLLPLYAVQNIVAACLDVRVPRVFISLADGFIARLFSWNLDGPVVRVCGVWSPTSGYVPLPELAVLPTVRLVAGLLLSGPEPDLSAYLVLERIEHPEPTYYLLNLAACRPLLRTHLAAASSAPPAAVHRYLTAA